MLYSPAWNISFQSAAVAFICPVGKQSLSSFQPWTKVYITKSTVMCLYREIQQCIFAFTYGINTWFPQLWNLRSFYVFLLTSTLGQSDNFYYFICGNLKHRERYSRNKKGSKELNTSCWVAHCFFPSISSSEKEVLIQTHCEEVLISFELRQFFLTLA